MGRGVGSEEEPHPLESRASVARLAIANNASVFLIRLDGLAWRPPSPFELLRANGIAFFPFVVSPSTSLRTGLSNHGL